MGQGVSRGGRSQLAGNHWKVKIKGVLDWRVEILLEGNAQAGLENEM